MDILILCSWFFMILVFSHLYYYLHSQRLISLSRAKLNLGISVTLLMTHFIFPRTMDVEDVFIHTNDSDFNISRPTYKFLYDRPKLFPSISDVVIRPTTGDDNFTAFKNK